MRLLVLVGTEHIIETYGSELSAFFAPFLWRKINLARVYGLGSTKMATFSAKKKFQCFFCVSASNQKP